MNQPTFREVSAADAVALARDGYRVIDVRETVEWDAGHIEGAVHVPLAEVPRRIAEVAPDTGAPLLLYCAVGARSARAAEFLARSGYTDVVSMKATTAEWRSAGGAWEEPIELPADRGAAAPLLAPGAHPRDRAGGSAQAHRRAGAPHRRGWPRIADRAVPRRVRRGDHRHRRRRRGRGVEPPAPGAPRGRSARHAQGRFGRADDSRAQPGDHRGQARRAPRRPTTSTA